MTRLTSIGAVLLATLAVGAVATSVAQAEEAPFGTLAALDSPPAKPITSARWFTKRGN